VRPVAPPPPRRLCASAQAEEGGSGIASLLIARGSYPARTCGLKHFINAFLRKMRCLHIPALLGPSFRFTRNGL
jgi:hypothetical protein